MWSVTRPDGTVATGWVLLPLRLFLGFTFLFAGLQKLANPQFLENASPTSIHAQLVGAARSSPIHALISHLVPIASTVGVVIALGEVAIGLGVLVGLLTRVAAVAGMALSFGLFLTVSFHSSPYFTGSDIVFFFAWTPLALAGAAGAPALDTWMAARQPGPARRPGCAVPSGRPVRGSGHRHRGRQPSWWPAASLPPSAGGRGHDLHLGRRIRCPARGRGRHHHDHHHRPRRRRRRARPTAPSGTAIGPASDVPVGGSASFTDPATGDPALVIQPTAGTFVAFDAVCPHAGCTVAYQPSAGIIACPCHGSEFDASTGAVLRGPRHPGPDSDQSDQGRQRRPLRRVKRRSCERRHRDRAVATATGPAHPMVGIRSGTMARLSSVGGIARP